MNSLTKKDLIYIFGHLEDIETKKKELQTELAILETYTGVKSIRLDQMIVGGCAQSLGDIIDKKDYLKARICKIEIEQNGFTCALDVLTNLERTVLFSLYGKNRTPIKQLAGSKKVDRYSKSEIYRVKDRAFSKMLKFINNDIKDWE